MRNSSKKKKTPILSFSLQQNEKNFVLGRAKSAGLTVSSYLQRLIAIDKSENLIAKHYLDWAKKMEAA